VIERVEEEARIVHMGKEHWSKEEAFAEGNNCCGTVARRIHCTFEAAGIAVSSGCTAAVSLYPYPDGYYYYFDAALPADDDRSSCRLGENIPNRSRCCIGLESGRVAGWNCSRRVIYLFPYLLLIEG